MTRCFLCGRQISQPKTVEFVGEVGTECYHKVAAFPAFLESKGLADAVRGGVSITNDSERNQRMLEGLNLLKRYNVAYNDFRQTETGPVMDLVIKPKLLRKAIQQGLFV
jgi:hypothetical protein